MHFTVEEAEQRSCEVPIAGDSQRRSLEDSAEYPAQIPTEEGEENQRTGYTITSTSVLLKAIVSTWSG